MPPSFQLPSYIDSKLYSCTLRVQLVLESTATRAPLLLQVLVQISSCMWYQGAQVLDRISSCKYPSTWSNFVIRRAREKCTSGTYDDFFWPVLQTRKYLHNWRDSYIFVKQTSVSLFHIKTFSYCFYYEGQINSNIYAHIRNWGVPK